MRSTAQRGFRAWLLLALLAACSPVGRAATPPIDRSTPVQAATPTAFPSRTPYPTPTRAPTWTPEPTLSPTPDAYEKYTIDYLRSRSYGGVLELTAKMDENPSFKRYSFRYTSDGLKISGFMNVPQGAGSHPVIIALHHNVDPAAYSILDATTPYADDLAAAGYIVIHPTLRNYPPSDNGENVYRVGMTIDVLNLIAIVKAQGGKDGPLQKADPARIGLWGESMGGGLALHVLTVTSDIKAALLYSPTNADEKINFEKFFSGADNPEAQQEASTPALEWFRISPVYFLKNISAVLSIHQGRQDPVTPQEWAESLCAQLKSLGKQAFCVYYDDMGHSFSGMTGKRFETLSVIFFDRYLAGKGP